MRFPVQTHGSAAVLHNTGGLFKAESSTKEWKTPPETHSDTSNNTWTHREETLLSYCSWIRGARLIFKCNNEEEEIRKLDLHSKIDICKFHQISNRMKNTSNHENLVLAQSQIVTCSTVSMLTGGMFLWFSSAGQRWLPRYEWTLWTLWTGRQFITAQSH